MTARGKRRAAVALPAPPPSPSAVMEEATRDVEQLRDRVVRVEALAQVVDDRFEEVVHDRKRRLHLSHLIEATAEAARSATAEASKLCFAMLKRTSSLRERERRGED
jgi:hypothetical protein